MQKGEPWNKNEIGHGEKLQRKKQKDKKGKIDKREHIKNAIKTKQRIEDPDRRGSEREERKKLGRKQNRVH